MEDLRIPVMGREVVIEFPDGVQAGGLVFVPAAAPDHDGVMRLGEWLNDADEFFPFRVRGEESSSLVNKRRVLSLTAYHTSDSSDYDEINDAPKVGVSLQTPYGKIDGRMVMEMPSSKLRALDVLNNGARFVFLIDGGREIHVNKRYIVSVSETTEGHSEEGA